MSELRSRLAALRQQSGGAPPDTDAESERPIDALRRRVERVGAARRRRMPPRERVDDDALSEQVGGERIHDGLIRIQERLDAHDLHGNYPLVNPEKGAALVLGDAPRDCVFMDTETTGLSGGTGTLVFLLGLARFRAGALEVVQLLMTRLAGEGAMLEQAREALDGADTLVTFNGRSFDCPLLAARYRLAGAVDPFAGLAHVDLLAATRRVFRRRWPDCRLQTAERRLLGLVRVDDLPGAEAPRAWFDWVRHGRIGALPGVCAHNRLDVLSLVVLPAALARSHDDPVATGADPHAWVRHRHRAPSGTRNDEGAAFDYLQLHRAALGTDGLLELARLARRRNAWPTAVAIWEELAARDEPTAIEHLAKYFEHQRKDYRRALEATTRLLAHAPGDPRHLRRETRLRGRITDLPY